MPETSGCVRPEISRASIDHLAQNALDVFCIAHALGWFGKAMILRDYWFCWVGAIAEDLFFALIHHHRF